MNEELLKVITSLGTSFETFKAENDKRIKQIEENGKVDPLLAEKIDRINADVTEFSKMKAQMDAIETAVARQQGHGGGIGGDPVSVEHKKAFNAWTRKGIEDGLRAIEVKAQLSTLSDPDGGFAVVPAELNRKILELAHPMSSMRSICDQMFIGTNEYSELVDQGGETAEWVGEKDDRGETASPTLSKVTWNPNELAATPYVTQLMLDDSFSDIEAWITKFLARAFVAKEAAAWITGSGVKQPKGIAAYTMIANSSYAWGKVGFITSGNAATLPSSDSLIKLQHALKVPYRSSARFLMNDATAEAIRLLKDSDGNNIWRPGLLEGQPDILLGKPISYDDNVASITNNTFPIFYGSFKDAYLIVDRMGIRMLRDPYTKPGFVKFYTTKRTGGGIRNFEAIKALKIAA